MDLASMFAPNFPAQGYGGGMGSGVTPTLAEVLHMVNMQPGMSEYDSRVVPFMQQPPAQYVGQTILGPQADYNDYQTPGQNRYRDMDYGVGPTVGAAFRGGLSRINPGAGRYR